MSFYDDASLIMYPSGYKEDKIYSLKPTNGSGDLTFTRASSATRVNAEGLIEEMPYNLLQYSEQFDNAVYSLTSSSISANAINSPIGTLTADKLVENTATNLHRVGQGSIPVTSGQVYTFSFYVKAAERDELELQRINTSGTVFNSISSTTADLTNGTLSVGSNVTASNIASVGDGWYRISISLTAIATGSGGLNIGMQKDGNVFYAGDGVSGVYLWGFQLNSGSTAKTYFPTTDRLNVPRIDYTGGGCGKLLLEPQRTNFIPYSEDFSNAAWAKQEITILQNVAISPDGTLNADKIIPSIVSTTHQINDLSLTSSQTCAMSIFAKADGLNTFDILDGSSASNGAAFDLLNGTFTNKGSGIGSMEYYGNGWYRCISVAVTTGFRIYCPSSAGSVSGDGTSGVYIWGAQLEAGSYATSYIPTSGATVTRTQDSSSKTGLSSVINSTEGVLYAEISAFVGASGGTRRIDLANSDTIPTKFVRFQIANGDGSLYVVVNNGTQQYLYNDTTFNAVNNNKIALKYSFNSFSLWINGVELNNQNSGSTFSAGDLVALTLSQNSNPFYGNVQNVMVFPSALTDDELETLTTL